MLQILLVLQVVIAVCMIALVLVQHGKGADVGATFGAGASNTVFGSSGHTPFLLKLTIVVAVLFFANSLAIGYLTVQSKRAGTTTGSTLLTGQVPAESQPTLPVTPGSSQGQAEAGSAFVPPNQGVASQGGESSAAAEAGENRSSEEKPAPAQETTTPENGNGEKSSSAGS